MSKFDDIVWVDHANGGIRGTILVNGCRVSLLAGSGFYSAPRENLNDPDSFEEFEVAVFAPNGNFVTQEFFPDIHDDVIGWQTREEINELIERVEKHTS